MQSLPKSVTGFDFPAPRATFKHFKTACHTAARQVGARVSEVRDGQKQVTPSFHEALVVLERGPETVRVLCNSIYPIVAFASPATREGDTRLRFADCPPLADAFGDQFCILTASHASAQVSAELMALLDEADLKDIHYWKPQQFGDLLFNYWD